MCWIFPSSDVGVQLAADGGNAHSNIFILKCAHSVSVHVCGDADGSVLERERNHKHHNPFIHTHTVLGWNNRVCVCEMGEKKKRSQQSRVWQSREKWEGPNLERMKWGLPRNQSLKCHRVIYRNKSLILGLVVRSRTWWLTVLHPCLLVCLLLSQKCTNKLWFLFKIK